MGNVTAKTSGEIASFMSPSVTNIKSLKVHFSPKQLGTGDPSLENIREIVGWDGVEVNGCGKNIAHIVGYSATVPASPDPSLRKTSNNYGTTINTTDFSLPDTKIIVTQSSYTTEYDPVSYRNGYFAVIVDNLDFTKRYNVSFNVDDIISNPLNVDLSRIRAISPAGTGFEPPAKIDGNRLFFKNVPFTSHSNYPNRKSFEIRNAGMSFTLSEFMVTPVDDENFEYEPYQGTINITNWSSDVGTVYGGYIDLISGELIENYKYVRLDANTQCTELRISDNGLYTIWYHINDMASGSIQTFYNDSNILCNNIQKVLSRGSIPTTQLGILFGNNSNNVYLYNMNYVYGYTTKEEISAWLEENPIHVTVPLATSITHQFTPAQLTSFVGQNNFWSNADYVEIEYDLIETIDIQKAKQKIILNQPQLKTISDKVVSFNTDMVAPMKNCKIYFKPIQEGTGDPSPTNVRNINGWTGLDNYVNGDKISVDWTSDAGTVYGGYIDLVKGELVATHVIFEKKWSEYPDNHAMTDVNRRSILFPYERRKIGAVKALCNIAPPAHDLQNKIHFYIAPENNYVYMFLPKDLDEETLIQVASKIEEPIHYQLTSQQLLTLKSTNHIWSETNGQQIDVTYWTRKNLTPTPLVNYLENQTWVDSAYISSSGKKTTNTVSASHFLTNQILLEAGTYVLSGFSYYTGSDSTRYRIHAYDSAGKWVKQITFQEIGNLSPVDISFTLDTDTYVNVSIAMDFDGVLTKIN